MDIDTNKQIVLTIRALYFSISDQWANVLQQYDISSAQHNLLFILSSKDTPVTISEISELGCWHISTVTRLLQPLLNRGFISIKNGKGRSKLVEMTKLGKQKLKDVTDDILQRDNFPLNTQGLSDVILNRFLEIGLTILRNQRGIEFTHWVQESKPIAIMP